MRIEHYFTEARIRTARGTFRILNATLEQAELAGFYLWFEEKDFIFVADGERAFAIAK